MSWFKNIFKKEKRIFRQGLEKSSQGFFDKISRAVVGKSKVDDEVLDELEDSLIASDVGVNTTVKIIERIEARVERDKYVNTQNWIKFFVKKSLVYC
jgi:fused signal recognition particle receptor